MIQPRAETLAKVPAPRQMKTRQPNLPGWGESNRVGVREGRPPQTLAPPEPGPV